MNSDTYWLNMTNIALGVVTAISLLVILKAVVAELLAHRRYLRWTEKETEL
jgi:heme exporter protein D